MQLRFVRRAAVGLAVAAGAALLRPDGVPDAPRPASLIQAPLEEPVAERAELEAEPLDCAERPLGVPSGRAPRLGCSEARAIVSEMHGRFAGVPGELDAGLFSELVSGWLDPHGLWSAAPDAPFVRALSEVAPAFVEELRAAPESSSPCRVARDLGRLLSSWVPELAALYDRGFARSAVVSAPGRAFARGAEPVFQDDPVTTPARVLARSLGERVGVFAATYAELAGPFAAAAREGYFPTLAEVGWSEAVLAAAVRAYVSLLDPHGAWAPLDEEWSLYTEDAALEGGPRLWGEVARTAVGARVVNDATPPLRAGDLVLEVDGVATAGMPLEQLEQLGRLEARLGTPRAVRVLRESERALRELAVEVDPAPDPAESEPVLDTESVRYGAGSALVVHLPDVPEDLGDVLERALSRARGPELSGVVLDLRGNGGGSAEAAAAVLGLFLPGAPLFPLAARGRLVEVMRAHEPAPEQRYAGPLAVLVDGYTASAAEMIAGALGAYGRAVVLGRRTFGKGCIQEYADDHLGRGVLRVTTLLFALPDGSAVQRSGLVPDVLLPVARAREREAELGGALPAYFGPDVRDARTSATWPVHSGAVGPCADPIVCGALRRLGNPAPAPRAAHARRVTGRPGALRSDAARP